MTDPAPRLPARPSLEQLRKQAKDLLHLVRGGDATAVQRVRAVIPDSSAQPTPPPKLILADAQFVVAREYGFENWAALTQYVDAVNPATRGPTTRQLIRPVEMEPSLTLRLPDGGSAPADTVWSMFTAALDGDLPRVKALVARHPGLARYEQNYTPPIHFAVREGHTDLVRFLLDHGADPAGYKSYPFQEPLLMFAEDRGHADVARVLREHLAPSFRGSATGHPRSSRQRAPATWQAFARSSSGIRSWRAQATRTVRRRFITPRTMGTSMSCWHSSRPAPRSMP